MARLLLFFKTYLLPLGGVGIFSITLLDSTFIPLPNVMDLTFIGFCLSHPARIPYYCLMATAGSVTGCYILFLLARGGSRFARKRIDKNKGVVEALGKHGGKALFVASLMPPPFPFKVFVFASGMFSITTPRFLLALIAGRGFRFVFQGAFAYFYGDAVIEYMKKDFPRVSLIVACIMAAMFVASYIAQRRLVKQ